MIRLPLPKGATLAAFVALILACACAPAIALPGAPAKNADAPAATEAADRHEHAAAKRGRLVVVVRGANAGPVRVVGRGRNFPLASGGRRVLRPGKYTISAPPVVGLPKGWKYATRVKTTVRVRPGRTTRVVVRYAGYIPHPPVERAAGVVSNTCSVRPSGAVACWGTWWDNGEFPQVNPRSDGAPVTIPGVRDIAALSFNPGAACGLRAAGTVICWGDATQGALGYTGKTGGAQEDERVYPTEIPGVTDAIDVALGSYHGCVAHRTGAVSCWGAGGSSPIYGDADAEGVPTDLRRVSGLSDAVAISAASTHTCAVRATGQLMCWGDNTHGQLGDGTTEPRSVPVPVAGIDRAVSVSTDYNRTCAVQAGGRVWCWGELRPAMGGEVHYPVPVAGIHDAVRVSVGYEMACAVRARGGVVCWGANTNGSLGNGVALNGAGYNWNADSRSAVTVRGLTGVRDITAFNSTVCAQMRNSSVRCWGYNSSGSLPLGNGTYPPARSRPGPALAFPPS